MASKVHNLIDRRSGTPVPADEIRPRFTAMKEPKKQPPKGKRKGKKHVPMLSSITTSCAVGRTRTCFGNYFKEFAEWKTGLSMTPAAKRMFDCMLTDFLNDLLTYATDDIIIRHTGFGKRKKTVLTIKALEYAVSGIFGPKREREMIKYIDYKSGHLDSAWPSAEEEAPKDELISDK